MEKLLCAFLGGRGMTGCGYPYGWKKKTDGRSRIENGVREIGMACVLGVFCKIADVSDDKRSCVAIW